MFMNLFEAYLTVLKLCELFYLRFQPEGMQNMDRGCVHSFFAALADYGL
jgi:hypothetical protein